jgi:hypothetical protein
VPPQPRTRRGPHPYRQGSGLGRFQSRQFAINAAWLELALVGIALLAWTRTLLPGSDHALAEPKKLRRRLLHVAAGSLRTARRTPPSHRPRLVVSQRAAADACVVARPPG